MSERAQAGSAVYWLAILCKPHRETQAAAHLCGQGFKVFLPKVRRAQTPRGRQDNEPLFPRYVFVQVNQGEVNVHPVRSTPGAVDWVRIGGELWPVPETLITAMRQVNVADDAADEALLASFVPEVKARAEDIAAFSDPDPQQRVWALLDRLVKGPAR
jgi:transcriptional antiterminator RfaH